MRSNSMTPEEQITEMTIAIKQAIKVMGDRFALAEGDVARAIQELKASISAAHGHIDITETLVRLYVFLAQAWTAVGTRPHAQPIRSTNFSRISRQHEPR